MISNKNKRDRLEVIYDILYVIKQNYNSIKPTPLMRYSNLSFKSFNEYEVELLEKEFMVIVEDKKGRKHYTLTHKGFKFLDKYLKMREFMEEFNL